VWSVGRRSCRPIRAGGVELAEIRRPLRWRVPRPHWREGSRGVLQRRLGWRCGGLAARPPSCDAHGLSGRHAAAQPGDIALRSRPAAWSTRRTGPIRPGASGETILDVGDAFQHFVGEWQRRVEALCGEDPLFKQEVDFLSQMLSKHMLNRLRRFDPPASQTEERAVLFSGPVTCAGGGSSSAPSTAGLCRCRNRAR